MQTPQVTNKNKLLDLVAWMRTHDPAEEYNWCSAGTCLIGQYSQHLGLPLAVNGYSDLCGGEVNYFRIARGAEPGEYAPDACWTFGQAVQRAEELLAA